MLRLTGRWPLRYSLIQKDFQETDCEEMANTFSALKRARQTKRRTAVNVRRKSRLRHAIRTQRRLLEKKDVAGATAALPATFSQIDRAARTGIIKANTAARYKSKLSLRLRALAAS
jgi:small subunit ribosomal protein S20